MSKPDRIPNRIRNNSNNDLFLNHLKSNSVCDCRNRVENGEHYFFKCRRYSDIRITLSQSTRTLHLLNTEKLLFGDEKSE